MLPQSCLSGRTLLLQNENKFMCPCHGSQYNKQGKVIRGPAPLVSVCLHSFCIHLDWAQQRQAEACVAGTLVVRLLWETLCVLAGSDAVWLGSQVQCVMSARF